MLSVLDPFRYAAVYARVHARLGYLLSADAWEDLLSAEGLSEFIQRLEDTPYGHAVAFLRREREKVPVDVGQLERALRGHWIRESRSLINYIVGGSGELLDWRWRRFELDNLKDVLRTVERDVDRQRAKASLVPLGAASRLDWDELLKSDSVAEVVDALDGTFYGKTLAPAMARYQSEGRLLILEVRLDLAYFRRLLDLIESLPGRDRREAERFLGTMIDSQNLLWAFRFRHYYDLSPEEILNYTLHHGIRVNAEVMQTVAQGAAIVDVLRSVWNGHLPGLEKMERMSEDEALEQAEFVFNRYQFDQAEKIRKQYAMHMGIILGYQVLVETEVNNLISAAEGKAANWSANQIRPYLITTKG